MSHVITEEPKSWLEKLAQALLGEPQDRTHLLQILRHASEKKLVDADSLAMLEGVIRFSELQVRDIMIPRAQLIAIRAGEPIDAIIDIVREHHHSRYPVYEDNLDNIIGILHAKDLLSFIRAEPPFSLSDVLRPAIVVPESKRLNVLLSEFKATKNHMAIVVDEYGGVSGVVTIEDIIEQIIGDIEDEFDHGEETQIKQHSDGRYIVKGQIPIEEFNEYFHTDYSSDNYDTLAGMLMKRCEHVPEMGDIIKVDNSQFKILNADNRRIKLVEYAVDGE